MFGLDDIAIGAGAGALGAGVLNYFGTQSTNSANAANAQAANQFSADQYATRYQTTVKDLQAAGLNPMLAYSQGAGSAPTGQMVQFQNPVSSAIQGWQAARGTESQATQSYASADQAKKSIDVMDSTIDKTKKETRNLDDEQTRLKAAYINLAESSALMAQQGQSEVIRRQVMDATARKMITENLINQAEYDAMKRTGFIGVTAREVKVLSDVSSEWVDKFLPWRQGKSVSEEHTDIVRDPDGREVGRSTYRSKR